MKTIKYDQIWANDREFLKVEKNGKPEYKALSFVMIENQAKFLKAFELPKTELDEFLNKSGFKPVDKILTLSEA